MNALLEMSAAEFRQRWMVVAWMQPTVDLAEQLGSQLLVWVKSTPFGNFVTELEVKDAPPSEE